MAELQLRGSPQTLAMAEALARSGNWRRRALGLHIASQLRRRLKRSSAEYALMETQQLLLAGLHDKREEVVRAAVSGLAHRPHPAAIGPLAALSRHQDHRMRWNVALSICRYQEPQAIEVLLRLMKDEDDLVRDWATFGLGTQMASDGPEIRAALWKNLVDGDEVVRGEALVGLAARKDPGVVDHLLTLLNADSRVYELHAAEMTADPRLLETLEAMDRALPEGDGYWRDCLRAAIEACRVGS